MWYIPCFLVCSSDYTFCFWREREQGLTFDLSGEHEYVATESADVLDDVFGDHLWPPTLVPLVRDDGKHQLKGERVRIVRLCVCWKTTHRFHNGIQLVKRKV